MFQFLRQLWHRLCARLRFCGGVQYLAGTASLPSPLSPAEEKALLARMAAGEADARDALILHNLRLVVYLAKKYENSGVPAEDLISIGTIGLIKAVNTFTPERSIKLATYASRCIENEILMHFRAQKKLAGEVSLADSLDGDDDGSSLSLMDVIAVDDNMLEELDTRDACRKVRHCVATCLTDRERSIITLRYGLDDRPPRTQREIASRCGISRSYVSRIEKRALEKLEKELRKG